MTINGGLRRQIHVDLSREKITALNLTPERVIAILRTENQNIPLGEINDSDRTLLLRSPGQFTNIDEIKNIVVMTREGVPVYMRDIAAYASKKRKAKGADWIVANDVSAKTGVLGGASNTVHLVTADGIEDWPTLPKEDVAERLMLRAAEFLRRSTAAAE